MRTWMPRYCFIICGLLSAHVRIALSGSTTSRHRIALPITYTEGNLGAFDGSFYEEESLRAKPVQVLAYAQNYNIECRLPFKVYTCVDVCYLGSVPDRARSWEHTQDSDPGIYYTIPPHSCEPILCSQFLRALFMASSTCTSKALDKHRSQSCPRERRFLPRI